MRTFRPRNLTAVFLSTVWFLISIFFISQGMMVVLWSIFALIAVMIGAAALWVLFNDRPE